MRINDLKKITKLYFSYEEIAKALDISSASARVAASRYVKKDILIRVKRNVYVLQDRWKAFSKEEYFQIANVLQVPSYISLMTALEFYDVTTQIQRGTVESITLKRTEEYNVKERLFLYTRISKELYTEFDRKKGFFIASAEKAFLDALYLKKLSRYDFDIMSIDLRKLNKDDVFSLVDKYPDRVKKEVSILWKS